jgi:hypothetical protein
MRSRLQRQADGSFSADLKKLPPIVVQLILKSPNLSISGVSLDDPGLSDLSLLGGLNLRSLSLAGCVKVTDLTPLRGMQLKTLDLSRTGVTDLKPLIGMPLEELTLEGCTGIGDFTPLSECTSLEKLILPRGARQIDLLREHPKLKYLSFKGLSEPVAEFWADFDKKRSERGPMPRVPPPKR